MMRIQQDAWFGGVKIFIKGKNIICYARMLHALQGKVPADDSRRLVLFFTEGGCTDELFQ
jgi:hypothetical protein